MTMQVFFAIVFFAFMASSVSVDYQFEVSKFYDSTSVYSALGRGAWLLEKIGFLCHEKIETTIWLWRLRYKDKARNLIENVWRNGKNYS